jgi:hypothetical protein
LERKGIQVQVFDSTHRHGMLKLPKGEIQKRTRRNNVQVRHFFMEVPESRDRLGTRLDFIEKQQSPALCNGLVEIQTKFLNHTLGFHPFEQRVQIILLFQVYRQNRLKTVLSEGFYEICLADLPGSAHDEWFPTDSAFPCNQLIFSKSLHFNTIGLFHNSNTNRTG